MDNHPIIPLDKGLEKWGTIAIDRFQEALVKANVGGLDGDLMRSFTKEVKAADGDAFRVLIKFLKTGRFPDMGVGRGFPIGSPNSPYKAKKWYSKTKTKEIAILRFIMAKNYTMLSVRQLETELKSIK